MAKDFTEIKGFEELSRKIKSLDDKVTRREVLKIQRQVAKPMIAAYSSGLPVGTEDKKRFGSIYPAGTLSKSVKAKTVPARKVGGNPQVVVRPAKKGRFDPFYRFMVIRKGAKPGSTRSGSRSGINDVVEKARDQALRKSKNYVTANYKAKVTRYVQKQIDKISAS